MNLNSFLEYFLKVIFFFSQFNYIINIKLFYKLNKKFIKKNNLKFKLSFFSIPNFYDMNKLKLFEKKNKKFLKIYPIIIKKSSVLFDSFFYIETLFLFKPNQLQLKEKITFIDYPFWFLIGLKTIKKLNNIQCKLFPQCFGSDSNILLSSPTGSGKTLIAMFSIFRVAINSIIFKTQHWKIKKNLVKILFIAPFKSIIKEKVIYF